MTLRRLRRLALAPAIILASACDNSVSIEGDVIPGNYAATSFVSNTQFQITLRK